MSAVEPILLSIAQITTRLRDQSLSNATGFFFRRDQRLYLITSRHVVIDEAAGHFPDSLQIDLFTDNDNLAETVAFSIPLYGAAPGSSSGPDPATQPALWTQAEDSSGTIDVVAIALQPQAMPDSVVYEAFTPDTICQPDTPVEVGSPLMVLGFPLGFADTLHNLPVARQAIVASSFGLRFQGMGYFLTDARTHRGISGGPVVMRVATGPASNPGFHWQLLGVHSSRLDMGNRDRQVDEALGLNCAWYADILLTLTIPPAADGQS
ncbi:trypsin-like peptidase domain-containing protein [Ketobacter sp.]|uniref:trypsin-like peptidase domain-containing protein n=1 Tax=Ketobacter sp. TaxID=2083498 RepID=UPI000F235754|nr:trypsin-like peptidase domain-containing protein [Ketobacter sp.]RLU01016.1 MAG: serine protease [Ketobacter sp.]